MILVQQLNKTHFQTFKHLQTNNNNKKSATSCLGWNYNSAYIYRRSACIFNVILKSFGINIKICYTVHYTTFVKN